MVNFSVDYFVLYENFLLIFEIYFFIIIYFFVRGISWATKDKVQQANYFGSLTQASSIRVGSYNGEEIYAPFKSLLPMVKMLNSIGLFSDFRKSLIISI